MRPHLNTAMLLQELLKRSILVFRLEALEHNSHRIILLYQNIPIISLNNNSRDCPWVINIVTQNFRPPGNWGEPTRFWTIQLSFRYNNRTNIITSNVAYEWMLNLPAIQRPFPSAQSIPFTLGLDTRALCNALFIFETLLSNESNYQMDL